MSYTKRQIQGFLGKGATKEVVNSLLEDIGEDPNEEEFADDVRELLLHKHKQNNHHEATTSPRSNDIQSESSEACEPTLTEAQLQAIRESVHRVTGEIQATADAMLESIVQEAVERSLTLLPQKIAQSFKTIIDSPKGKELLRKARAESLNYIDVTASEVPQEKLKGADIPTEEN